MPAAGHHRAAPEAAWPSATAGPLRPGLLLAADVCRRSVLLDLSRGGGFFVRRSGGARSARMSSIRVRAAEIGRQGRARSLPAPLPAVCHCRCIAGPWRHARGSARRRQKLAEMLGLAGPRHRSAPAGARPGPCPGADAMAGAQAAPWPEVGVEVERGLRCEARAARWPRIGLLWCGRSWRAGARLRRGAR